MEDQLE
jgi:hypothetical protein